MNLFEIECSRIDWEVLNTCGGVGANTIHEKMLAFSRESDCGKLETLSGELEVTMFPQRTIFEAALAFIPAMWALVAEDPFATRRNEVFVMFYEIGRGYAAHEETRRGKHLLHYEAVVRLRQGLLLLYDCLFATNPSQRGEIFDLLGILEATQSEPVYQRATIETVRSVSDWFEFEAQSFCEPPVAGQSPAVFERRKALARALKNGQTPPVEEFFRMVTPDLVSLRDCADSGTRLARLLMAALQITKDEKVKLRILEYVHALATGDDNPVINLEYGIEAISSARASLQDGLWLLYRELLSPNARIAFKILQRIDPDQGRIRCFGDELGVSFE